MSAANKPDVCMTCHAPVDWRYSETLKTWQPFEAGTKAPHKCQKEGD